MTKGEAIATMVGAFIGAVIAVVIMFVTLTWVLWLFSPKV